jgi:hypothetical protein
MDVAASLEKQTYFDKVIIEHKHPLWTGEQKDTIYSRNDVFIKEDNANYLKRRGEGFPR